MYGAIYPQCPYCKRAQRDLNKKIYAENMAPQTIRAVCEWENCRKEFSCEVKIKYVYETRKE